MHEHLLPDLALTIIVATALGVVAKSLKQPIVLAYMIAGVVIGPHFGPKLIKEEDTITLISEIGLVLLLFMTGLEIELAHLKHTSREVIVTGLVQVALTFLLGLGVFSLLGFSNTTKRFDLTYLAFAMAMSSTLITVKLLYDKFELDTLPGRISIGILLTQDIYAILAKMLQKSLGYLSVLVVLISVIKIIVLMAVAAGLARYVLQALLRSVAKMPELVFVVSLAWCCVICALALQLGVSTEMGALIAGVSISSLPYSIEVISKVTSIRDFFVLLFFAGIGMEVSQPSTQIVTVALCSALFVFVSRLLTVSPLLHRFRNGNRASIIPAINLAHLSEFSVVIAASGYRHYHHVSKTVVQIIVLTFVLTSAISAYTITYNHRLFLILNRLLGRLGVRDLSHDQDVPEAAETEEAKIALLGFFNVASSLVEHLQHVDEDMRRRLLVVDFNPQVNAELRRRGISCVYGDIASFDTLQHAGLQKAELVVSTIPDSILRGTDNARLFQIAKRLCPEAKIVLTAESIDKALKLYDQGADYVLLPRLLSAEYLVSIMEYALRGELDAVREGHLDQLRNRTEIIK